MKKIDWKKEILETKKMLKKFGIEKAEVSTVKGPDHKNMLYICYDFKYYPVADCIIRDNLRFKFEESESGTDYEHREIMFSPKQC